MIVYIGIRNAGHNVYEKPDQLNRILSKNQKGSLEFRYAQTHKIRDTVSLLKYNKNSDVLLHKCQFKTKQNLNELIEIGHFEHKKRGFIGIIGFPNGDYNFDIESPLLLDKAYVMSNYESRFIRRDPNTICIFSETDKFWISNSESDYTNYYFESNTKKNVYIFFINRNSERFNILLVSDIQEKINIDDFLNNFISSN